MEVEAKFRATKAIKPSEIEALDFSPYTLGPRVEHELHDTLLDTPGRTLAQGRYALRVRQDGDETVLTLKAPAQAEGGVHRREEWEEPLNGGAVDDVATWPESFRGRVRELVGEQPLHEILRVRNHRRTWDVFQDGQRVGELALDKGTIEAHDASLSLHEIEVELKDGGEEAVLEAIAHILRGALPLEPEHQSKMQRGLALLEQQEAEQPQNRLERAAKRVAMEPTAPLAEAGRSVLAGHLRKLVENLPIAREGEDPEGVHDARVATRRLRAVMKVLGERVYEPKPIRKLRRGLRALAADLGIVRDADVFLLALDEYAAGLPEEERAGLKPLYKRVEKERNTGREALLKVLDSKKQERLIARLTTFVTTAEKGVRDAEPEEGAVVPTLVREHAGSLLWQGYEAIRAYEPTASHASIETLHRLRIEVKRLRYTLDLFMDALDPEAKVLHKMLVQAQDHLGDLHDAEVAIAYVGQVLGKHQGNLALLNYRANRMARREELYRTAGEVLEPLFGLGFRQGLAALISKM